MAERRIYRKSQLFFDSLIAIKVTPDTIEQKFGAGKFPFSVTGIIKFVGFLVEMAALITFLIPPLCPNADSWYPYLFPCVTGIQIVVTIILYVLFSLGAAVHKPGVWVKADIVSQLLLSVITIIASVMTMLSCNAMSSVYKIPGPLGICAGSILLVSCGAIFFLYRFKKDEDDTAVDAVTPGQTPVEAPRVSMQA